MRFEQILSFEFCQNRKNDFLSLLSYLETLLLSVIISLCLLSSSIQILISEISSFKISCPISYFDSFFSNITTDSFFISINLFRFSYFYDDYYSCNPTLEEQIELSSKLFSSKSRSLMPDKFTFYAHILPSSAAAADSSLVYRGLILGCIFEGTVKLC